MIALSAVLIALRAATTLWSEERSYHHALNAGRTTLERTVRLAEVGTLNLLRELDVTLGGIEQVIDVAPSGTPLGAPWIQHALRQFDARTGVASDILIVDIDGRVVNRAKATVTGRGAPPRGAVLTGGPDPLAELHHQPVSLLGRFTKRLGTTRFDRTTSGGVATHRVGEPVVLQSGTAQRLLPGDGWPIIVGQPLMRDGATVGMIAVELPMAVVVSLYDAISPPDGTRVELLRDNGAAIVDRAGRTATIDAIPMSAHAKSAAAIRRPSLIEISEEERAPVVRASRQVADYPLIISASRGTSDILRQWRQECVNQAIGFGVFALTVAGLAWIAAYALRRGQFATVVRRRTEASLNRQAFLLQSTLESIGEGLSVFDRHGRLIARNRRFCELLELPADLPMNVPLREILTLQAVRGDFGDTLSPEAEVELRLEKFYRNIPIIKERLTPSGRILQIRRGSMPAGAVVSIYSDITELKASEHKLLEARSQAELANHSKSEFLANMSHELRTPLNAIIGFTEIIAQELFGPIINDKYLEYIKDVHSSSLHLLSIINDVLDMSKIEAGKLELQKEPVTLQSAIADAIRIVHERASIRSIELVTGSSIDPVVISADERSIKQVLLNLLSNAIKFSNEDSKIRISVRIEPPDWAVIEVEDHGIGMNAEEQKRALQPFGQAKPATTRNYGGTGLGLPITKGLVEAHGGSLTISSRSGEGTTVCLRLPIGTAGVASLEPSVAPRYPAPAS